MAVVFYFINPSQLSPSQKVEYAPTTPDDEADENDAAALDIEFYYESEGKLYAYGPAGESELISAPDQFVVNFVSSEDRKTLVYVSAVPVNSGENHDRANMDSGDKAVYLKVGTDEPRLIYEMATEVVEGTDLRHSIKDIGAAEDGSKIAITTARNVLVYDVKEESLVELFSEQAITSPPTHETVFAYTDPVFSPDKRKLLYKIGYYEGSGAAVIDLETLEVMELPFRAYIGGAIPFAWHDDETLLLRVKDSMGGDAFGTPSHLKTMSLDNLEDMETLATVSGGILATNKLGSRVYFMVDYRNEDGFAGARSDGTQATDSYKIYELDLETRTLKTVYEQSMSTFHPESPFMFAASKLVLSPQANKLYFTSQVNDFINPENLGPSGYRIMELDLTNRTSPTVILNNASLGYLE